MAMETATGWRLPKTKEDWRLTFHMFTLVVTPVLLLIGISGQTWEFWSGLGLGLIDSLLAFVLTPDGIRKVLYAIGGVVTAVAGFLHYGDPVFVTALVAAIATALSSFIASFYTASSVASQVPSPIE